ncbi:unnamed protein product, partial [Laminaria digitata]
GALTLTRFKLSGGYATEGGAIFAHCADLTLVDCVFQANVATNRSGGAVLADGGALEIVAGEFLGNNASQYGGAVHAVNGNLVVHEGSRFEGNTAVGGGALFCGSDALGPATPEATCSIIDAVFSSNSAASE